MPNSAAYYWDTRHASRSRRWRGFSLIDLYAVIALVLIALGFLLRLVNLTVRENSGVSCRLNLRQVGLAIQLYVDETKCFPRTRYDPSEPKAHVYTNPAAPNPFADAGPQPNDVTAAWFLLLRTKDITSAVFICPSSDQTADQYGGGTHISLERSNFSSRDNLSYSFISPYAHEFNHVQVKWGEYGLPASCPIAADMNPGAPELLTLGRASSPGEMRKANSRNHQGEGQHVLYADGHVEFQDNPFVGIDGDNIYTAGPVTDYSGGTTLKAITPALPDVLLLPTENDGRTKASGPIPPISPYVAPLPPTIFDRLHLTPQSATLFAVGLAGMGVWIVARLGRYRKAGSGQNNRA